MITLFPSLISNNVNQKIKYYGAHTFWAMQNAEFNVKCNMAISVLNYYQCLRGFRWLPYQTLIIIIIIIIIIITLKSLRSPPNVSHWDNNTDIKMVIKMFNQIILKFESFGMFRSKTSF